MASISGSSEMSLRKFDRTNFNFWKEDSGSSIGGRNLINV
jgi:hypothetical protein